MKMAKRIEQSARLNEKRRLIKKTLMAAKDELSHYSKNEDYEHLMQAAEKCWVAFTLILELNGKKELLDSKDIRDEVASQDLFDDYDIFYGLHVFHYEGMGEAQDMVLRIQRNIRKLEKMY